MGNSQLGVEVRHDRLTLCAGVGWLCAWYFGSLRGKRFLCCRRIFGLKARVCWHADFGNVAGAGALQMGFPSAGLILVCIPVRRKAA